MVDAPPSLRRAAARAFAACTLGSAVAGAAVGVALGRTGVGAGLGLSVPALLALASLPSLGAHGRPTLGPANAVTLARAVLVAGCAAALGVDVGDGGAWLLVGASCAAFGLDWVDGRIARATGSASPFGARLDMELDALTILVLSALVWQLGRAPAWVFASGAMRYAFVAAGFAWTALTRPLFPSRRRAFVCGVQVVCLVGALAPWPWAWVPWAGSAVGLAALTGSFAVDTAWLVARARAPLPEGA